MIETTDGGKSWLPVVAAQQPPGKPDSTVYTDIVFMRNHGIITGWSKARSSDNRPEWQAPDSRSYETPGTTIFLETSDGGKTWTSSSGAMFGELTVVSLSLNGTSLALFEFAGRKDSRMVNLPPSEVHRMSARNGCSGSSLPR